MLIVNNNKLLVKGKTIILSLFYHDICEITTFYMYKDTYL